MGPKPAGDLGFMGRGAGGKNKGRESVGGDRTESRELLGHPFKRVNNRVVGRGEVPVGVTNYLQSSGICCGKAANQKKS